MLADRHLALCFGTQRLYAGSDVRPGLTLRDEKRTVGVGNESFHSGTIAGPYFRVTRIMPDGSRRYLGIESWRLLLGIEVIDDAERPA